MDQTWSNWSSHQSKNVAIKSCHIYHGEKNHHYIFDQIGSELSKMDQTWSNWNSPQLKNVDTKSCHIYHEDINGNFIFNQIGSGLIFLI